MAKDQFKKEVKVTALTSRFSVLPLIDKGDSSLCVDANFNFLLVKKERLNFYAEMALPETFQEELLKQAIEAAKPHLPSDPKAVERLVLFLKQKGTQGFADELTKALSR